MNHSRSFSVFAAVLKFFHQASRTIEQLVRLGAPYDRAGIASAPDGASGNPVTRLPTLNARKVIQALERAGFIFARRNGSHMVSIHPTRHSRTSVPRHNRDLNRNLMKLILKQAVLTEDQFRELL